MKLKLAICGMLIIAGCQARADQKLSLIANAVDSLDGTCDMKVLSTVSDWSWRHGCTRSCPYGGYWYDLVCSKPLADWIKTADLNGPTRRSYQKWLNVGAHSVTECPGESLAAPTPTCDEVVPQPTN